MDRLQELDIAIQTLTKSMDELPDWEHIYWMKAAKKRIDALTEQNEIFRQQLTNAQRNAKTA